MSQHRRTAPSSSRAIVAGGLLAALGCRLYRRRRPARAGRRPANSRSPAISSPSRPARIEVQKDDLVKITFTAKDIAHSFTIDQYRIAKRAGAGPDGRLRVPRRSARHLRFYCNLTRTTLQDAWKAELDRDADRRISICCNRSQSPQLDCCR